MTRLERRSRVGRIQFEDSGDDRIQSGLTVNQVLVSGHEESGYHPARIRPQQRRRARDNQRPIRADHRRATDGRRAYCNVATIASVDSAPWLVLRPVAVSASNPPPLDSSHIGRP